MKSLIGIALEQFEYNERWKAAVIFLTFFSFSTVSLQFLIAPKIEITKENGNAAIALISDKLNLSEHSENRAQGLFDKMFDKFSNTRISDHPKHSVSTSVDDAKKQIDDIKNEPTTLETLNED